MYYYYYYYYYSLPFRSLPITYLRFVLLTIVNSLYSLITSNLYIFLVLSSTLSFLFFYILPCISFCICFFCNMFLILNILCFVFKYLYLFASYFLLSLFFPFQVLLVYVACRFCCFCNWPSAC